MSCELKSAAPAPAARSTTCNYAGVVSAAVVTCRHPHAAVRQLVNRSEHALPVSVVSFFRSMNSGLILLLRGPIESMYERDDVPVQCNEYRKIKLWDEHNLCLSKESDPSSGPMGCEVR